MKETRKKITLNNENNILSLSVYPYTTAYKKRFLLQPDRVKTWLDSDDGSDFNDIDVNNAVQIRRTIGNSSLLYVRLYWLDVSDATGTITGRLETFYMHAFDLWWAATYPGKHVVLDKLDIMRADVKLVGSIAPQLVTRQRRKAWSRAMCQMAHGRGEVTVYANRRDEAYFRRSSGVCGALVLSECDVRRDGVRRSALVWGVHT